MFSCNSSQIDTMGHPSLNPLLQINGKSNMGFLVQNGHLHHSIVCYVYVFQLSYKINKESTPL